MKEKHQKFIIIAHLSFFSGFTSRDVLRADTTEELLTRSLVLLLSERMFGYVVVYSERILRDLCVNGMTKRYRKEEITTSILFVQNGGAAAAFRTPVILSIHAERNKNAGNSDAVTDEYLWIFAWDKDK